MYSMRKSAILGHHIAAAALVFGMTAAANAAAPKESERYVSGRIPITGSSREIAATRPAGLSPSRAARTRAGHPTNTWTKIGSLSGAVVALREDSFAGVVVEARCNDGLPR